MHPAKPKIGIRASKTNEIWHIDTTLIRLVDGTKAYVHAVIDNFSRRILSWRVGGSFDPGNTLAVLLNASRSSTDDDPPTVLADGGVENFNGGVDELIRSGLLRRVLAMTELRFSNSMIEAWWRALKHQWLFLNTLDSAEKVEKLVAFYVKEHNERLPHSAFRGQTPDEMYFEGGEGVPDALESRKKDARRKRLAMNRALSCAVCEPEQDSDAALTRVPSEQQFMSHSNRQCAWAAGRPPCRLIRLGRDPAQGVTRTRREMCRMLALAAPQAAPVSECRRILS